MLTKRSFARLLKGVLGEKLYADLRRRSLAFRSNRSAFTEIHERQLLGVQRKCLRCGFDAGGFPVHWRCPASVAP